MVLRIFDAKKIQPGACYLSSIPDTIKCIQNMCKSRYDWHGKRKASAHPDYIRKTLFLQITDWPDRPDLTTSAVRGNAHTHINR